MKEELLMPAATIAAALLQPQPVQAGPAGIRIATPISTDRVRQTFVEVYRQLESAIEEIRANEPGIKQGFMDLNE